MPSDVMMRVGDYEFSIDSAAYETVRRTWGWRWAPQDVLGAAPFQQYVGPGGRELAFDGLIHPHHKGGLGQLAAMQAQADRGEPLVVIDSTGRAWGVFCITDLVETRRAAGPGGLPLEIAFRLTLRSTADDRPPQAAAVPSTNAAG